MQVSMHVRDDVASNAPAIIFRGTVGGSRSRSETRAMTVKCSTRKASMMPALRIKATVHESSPEGALVYRKPSWQAVEPGRALRRRGCLALPHGAGVRRCHRAVGRAL